MSTRQELEAAVLAAPHDRDVLAVYGDHLQAAGDPCGELIALDLQIERHADPRAAGPRRYRHAPLELFAQRAAVLRAMLGDELASAGASAWIGNAVRLGFIDDLAIGPAMQRELAALLAVPLGRYLRSVTLHGDRHEIAMLLAVLAGTHHTWLTGLTIVTTSAGPVIAFEREVVAATPRLVRLELRGHPVFRAIPHPALRTLCVEGPAVAALADLELPGVTALEVAFDVHRDALGALVDDRVGAAGLRSGAPLAALFSIERLPELCRLDLSRNEPPPGAARWTGQPVGAGGSVFALLGEIDLRHRLTHVRLPAVCSERDYALLQEALAAMPALVELVVARGHYLDTSGLHHRTARIVRAAAWPWPAPEQVRPDAALQFAMDYRTTGCEPYGQSVTVPLRELVMTMERQFEDLPGEARDAWTAFWHQAAGLIHDGPDQVLPTELAIAMLAPLVRDVAELGNAVVFSGRGSPDGSIQPTMTIRMRAVTRPALDGGDEGFAIDR